MSLLMERLAQCNRRFYLVLKYWIILWWLLLVVLVKEDEVLFAHAWFGMKNNKNYKRQREFQRQQQLLRKQQQQQQEWKQLLYDTFVRWCFAIVAIIIIHILTEITTYYITKKRTNKTISSFKKSKSILSSIFQVQQHQDADFFKFPGNRPTTTTNDSMKNTIDVIVVGCGLPYFGLGWFHTMQLLSMSNVNIRAVVVEPHILSLFKQKSTNSKSNDNDQDENKNNKKKNGDQESTSTPIEHFIEMLQQCGILLVSSISDLPPPSSKKTRMFILAGTITNENNNDSIKEEELTEENKRAKEKEEFLSTFRQCIDKGANVIYLEPQQLIPISKDNNNSSTDETTTTRTVAQMRLAMCCINTMETVQQMAQQYQVLVYVGFTKTTSPYIHRALSLANSVGTTTNNGDKNKANIVLVQNHGYTPNDLGTVFGQNHGYSMLQTMLLHELVVLVTNCRVRKSNIMTLKVNTSPIFTERLLAWRAAIYPETPRSFTDFCRVAFQITAQTKTKITTNQEGLENNNNNGVNDCTKTILKATIMGDYCAQESSVSSTTSTTTTASDSSIAPPSVCFALVKDPSSGKILERFEFPDEETMKQLSQQEQEEGEKNDILWMGQSQPNNVTISPHFWIHANDYLTVKQRIVSACLHSTNNSNDGDKRKKDTIKVAQGIATIEMGVEGLKLANFAMAQINTALDAQRRE